MIDLFISSVFENFDFHLFTLLKAEKVRSSSNFCQGFILITRTKMSIRYAKENDREKRGRRRER